MVALALALVLGCGGTSPGPAPDAPSAPSVVPEKVRKHPPRRRRTEAEQADERAEIEALEAMGYLAGVEKATGLAGVTLRTPEAGDGTNLVVSAHGFEVVLIDMDGEVLHTWRLAPGDRKGLKHDHFRRAWLLDGGALLALVEGSSLLRLDRDGAVTWRVDDVNHHDVHVLPDGSLWALVRTAHRIPWFAPNRVVLDDALVRYGPDGGIQQRIPLLEALRDGGFDGLVEEATEKGRDPLHTNGVEVIEADAVRHPAFVDGRLVLSMRSISALAVVDPSIGQVVWAAQGRFKRQHDPHVLPNGHVLLFDNHAPTGPSAVLRYDPADMDLVWSYDGGDADRFYSKTCSTAALVDGGQVLVTVSNPGFAFQVTRDGRRTWQYHSPFRTGDDGALVAQLYDVVRYPPADALGWLGR